MTIGKAIAGEAGVVILKTSVYWSVASRLRVAAVATIDRPGAGEDLVAAGVVEMPVGVDQPRNRLPAGALDRLEDILGPHGNARVDHGETVRPAQDGDVAAGPLDQMEASRELDGLDRDLGHHRTDLGEQGAGSESSAGSSPRARPAIRKAPAAPSPDRIHSRLFIVYALTRVKTDAGPPIVCGEVEDLLSYRRVQEESPVLVRFSARECNALILTAGPFPGASDSPCVMPPLPGLVRESPHRRGMPPG